MKKLLRTKGFALATICSFILLSCSNDDDNGPVVPAPTQNIVQLASGNANLSSLVAALGQADAGLATTLSGAGPFTVFAPTNAAFTALLNALGDNYNSLADFDTQAEKDLLRDILLYHVIPAEVKSTDLAPGNVATAFSGNSIEVIASGSTFVIGDASATNANIAAADVAATNGVVHVIDKVLLPESAVAFLNSLGEEEEEFNIVQTAQSVEDLSLLVDALIQADAGLVEVLSGTGPFTVFAPTNAAFAALLDALGDDFNSLEDFDTPAEKELLAKVLTYHVVSGAAALSTDLTNGQMIATVQGENVTVNLTGGVFIQDATETDAAVVMADVETSNGVVHIIDKVLLPQEVLDALNPPLPNIVATAQSVPDLSLLVDALIQADAGLVEVLSGTGPFTVFAPTNAAFVALLDALGPDFNSLEDFDTPAEKELLAKVLTYHVVAGTAAFSTDLTEGQTITTVQGENIGIHLTGGVFIQDAVSDDTQVIMADVETSNGVVHVINKVLLPQEVLDLLNP